MTEALYWPAFVSSQPGGPMTPEPGDYFYTKEQIGQNETSGIVIHAELNSERYCSCQRCLPKRVFTVFDVELAFFPPDFARHLTWCTNTRCNVSSYCPNLVKLEPTE